MPSPDLAALFEPRGIVVVGASSTPGKLGHAMAASLESFPGDIRLVNPRPGPGMFDSVASAADQGGPLDLAVLCVPAATTATAIRESARAGVRAALVCAGGFAEAGGIGFDHAQAVDDAVSDTGIRLLGPNTSGFFIPGASLFASFVPGVREFGAGHVAVVAASGGVNHVLSFLLQEHADGVSIGVGVGAGQDITAPDVLSYLRDHEATRAVILHIETVPDGAKLLDAIRALSTVKPVIALVIGRSDVSEFATSHTGALTTSWRVTRAALRQAGAVLVDDEDQAVAAAVALSGRRGAPRARPGHGLITGQAGPGLIIADHLASAGEDVPPLASSSRERLGRLLPPMTFQGNPVDTGRPSETFGEVIEAVADDPGVDVLGIYAITEPVVDLAAAVPASARTLPVVLGVDGTMSGVAEARRSARRHQIPILRGPTRLAQAMAAIAEDARLQEARRQDKRRIDLELPAPGAFVGAVWDEIRAKDLLDELGLSTPPRCRCADRAAAHSAFAELGGRVAVKLVDAAVLHKTDIGGVVLGVDSAAALDAALDSLESAGASEFLVEAMAAPGVDLIVGARIDDAFGPVVALGLGGTTAEVLADVAIRTAPLSTETARRMVDDLATAALLRGYRGSPAVDEDELGRVIATLGQLVASGAVLEIEINPLRISADGLVALDAVVLPVHDAVKE